MMNTLEVADHFETARFAREHARAPTSVRASAIVLALLPSIAHAQFARDLATPWVIVPSELPAAEFQVRAGAPVLKQELRPLALGVLNEDAVDAAGGKLLLPKGTRLIFVQSASGTIYCSLPPAKGPSAARSFFLGNIENKATCLLDRGQTSTFTAWFKAPYASTAVPMVQGSVPRDPKIVRPVTIAREERAALDRSYFVAIEFRDYFNIYNRKNFTIAFGSDDRVERITMPISIRAGAYPADVTVLGSRFTVLAEGAGLMSVRVDQTMPAQPFSVYKTTTYR